jgi:hypothetical protein
MRRLPQLACAAAATLLAGCGNAQVRPPDVSVPVRPAGSTPAAYDAQGVRLAVPGGWHARAGTAPLVTTVQSGPAIVAIWRYPRSETLPATRGQLVQARDLLLAAARARDPSFRAKRTTITRLDRHPAVEVRGAESVGGLPRMVRSMHVYAFGGEVVVDAYAPPAVFARVDREAFRPLLRSLRLRAPAS